MYRAQFKLHIFSAPVRTVFVRDWREFWTLRKPRSLVRPEDGKEYNYNDESEYYKGN